MTRLTQVVPAILTDDTEALETLVRQAESFATYVQFDIMDGRFVTSHSITWEHLAALDTALDWEVHLMVEDPDQYLAAFLEAGASRIIAVDINSHRLEAALKFGADAALPAGADLIDRIKDTNEGRPADLVIVCTGATEALNQAFYAVDRGGTILFFAPADPDARVEMPFAHVWWQEVKITSSYAGSPRDIRAAVELISSGRINVADMITHRLPLEKTAQGFSLVESAGRAIKVIIEPQN